jgi:hypothetical protein
MGMIRRGRKRRGATRNSLRSQAGVGKETLGGCRECHGETPRQERLFEVTEVGADVRFVERDGLHRRRRFMSDVGGRAGAARTFSEVWPFADLILQTKVRSAPQAAIPAKLACDQTKRVPDPLGEPRCRSLHSRHRFAAADPGLLIRRAFPDFRAVKSSILERNSLRIGEVFALL